MGVTRNLTRDLVRGLTRGVTDSFWVGFSLTAPEDYEWLSADTDLTPLTQATFTDLQVGDVGRIQFSTDVGFTSPVEYTNTADSAESIALLLQFTATSQLTAVQYWSRCRHERGATVSDWSNVITETLTGVLPAFTSGATANCAEDAQLSHALTTDGAGGAATFTIVGGADAADFQISTAELQWASDGTKDYDAPDDTGANNVYDVIVRATNAQGNSVDQSIAITVTQAAKSLTWISKTPVHTNSANDTISISLDIGTASADRLIVVAISTGALTSFVSMVVNGVTLTKDDERINASQGAAIFSGIVASGSGAQTCVLTTTGGSFIQREFSIYALTGLAQTTKRTSANGLDTAAISVTAGHYLIAVCGTFNAHTGNFNSSTETPEHTNSAADYHLTSDWLIDATNAAFSIAKSGNLVGVTYF